MPRNIEIKARIASVEALLLARRTRIHLDRVEGLGDFIELEVVLADDEPAAAGVAVASELLAHLGITPDRLVAAAHTPACA